MTKAAIKKRLQRDKESAEQSRARLDKMNQDKKDRLAKENQAVGDVRRTANREGMRNLRASKKAITTDSTDNIAMQENSSVELAHPRGGNSTENSLVRKRKPIDFTMADLEADKTDDEDEYLADVQPSTSRKIPKRSCARATTYVENNSDSSADEFLENDDIESQDASFNFYIDDLVEMSVNQIDQNDSLAVILPILDDVVNIATTRKPKSRGKKGQSNIGRKSAKAKNFQKHWDSLSTGQQKEKLKKKAIWLKNYRENEESEINYERRVHMQAMNRGKERLAKTVQRQAKDAEWHSQSRENENQQAKQTRKCKDADHHVQMKIRPIAKTIEVLNEKILYSRSNAKIADALLKRGKYFLHEKKYKWAQDDFNSAKSLKPDYYETVLSLTKSVDEKSAEEDISFKWKEVGTDIFDDKLLENQEEILKICRKHPIPQNMLDDILKVLANIFALGNWFFLQKEYKRAYLAYSDACNHFDYLAHDFIDNHDGVDYDLEEGTVERILNIELPCRLQLVETQIHLEKYEEALEDNQILMGYDQDQVRVNYQRGCCHYFLKEYRLARSFLSAAIKMDQSNKDVFDMFEKIEHAIEDCRETITKCSEIIKSQKFNFIASFQRAQSYLYLQKEFDLAISDLIQAKKLNKAKSQQIDEMIVKLQKDKNYYKGINTKTAYKKI